MGERTQPNLETFLGIVNKPAPPHLMERRRQAFLEIAETLAPQSPLWATMGLRRASSEEEYMIFLRRLYERSGLSYQQLESRTLNDKTIETVPRSTIHGVLNRNRLPRRETQLRALLVVLVTANHGTAADLDDLLTLRTQLIMSRTKSDQVAEAPASDPTEEHPAIPHGRHAKITEPAAAEPRPSPDPNPEATHRYWLA